MRDKLDRARELLHEFKGDDYVFGVGCFEQLGGLAAALGRRASVITSGIGKPWGPPIHERTRAALAAAGIEPAGEPIRGARPNSPREDVRRLVDELEGQDPDVIVAAGGGSGIDAAKAAAAMLALREKHPDLEHYFGVGKVTQMLEAEGARMRPVVAAQLAAGSAAHLTKYANVTDLGTHQKKLIVDEAVIPPKALFDYQLTTTMSKDFTADGALDGVAHALEVFYGAKDDVLERVTPVSCLAIDLTVGSLNAACNDPNDLAAREALGLATDLGGYAIMIGGTNGGRDLGLAVADAMIALSRDIGFPTTLSEVEGFSAAHVDRALTAAKNPQLEMKLKAMPVPLSAETVDDYMGPVLEAATTGDFSLIRNVS